MKTCALGCIKILTTEKTALSPKRVEFSSEDHVGVVWPHWTDGKCFITTRIKDFKILMGAWVCVFNIFQLSRSEPRRWEKYCFNFRCKTFLLMQR